MNTFNPTILSPEEFSSKLLLWYQMNKRDLPWRSTKDPYRILISEIILQQTRVQQGLPYYLRFIEKFPTLKDLAEASEQQVLMLWQGLGYYSRARNLHYTSKQIMEKYNGLLPDIFLDLKSLKGIGTYSASAIASFAFDQHYAVVDGNVYRVLARVYGIDADISTKEGINIFQNFANTLLPKSDTSFYNQAIMEFGALYCVPGRPACEACIFANSCFAYIHSLQIILPVKTKKTIKKIRYFNYIVIKWNNKLALIERTKSDIWKGLYEFHLVESNNELSINELIDKNPFGKNIQLLSTSQTYKHILTHQTIYAKFTIQEFTDDDKPNLQYYSYEELLNIPKPILISKFLSDYNFV